MQNLLALAIAVQTQTNYVASPPYSRGQGQKGQIQTVM